MSRFLSLCYQRSASGRLARLQEWMKSERRLSQLEAHEMEQTLEILLASCVGKTEGVGRSTTETDSALTVLKSLTKLKEAETKNAERETLTARAQTCLALIPYTNPKHIQERYSQRFNTEKHTESSSSPQDERKKTDSKERYQMLLEATQKKDMFATFHLGVCYDIGLYVEEDKDKALQLYKKASDMGLPKAMVNLGVFLERQTPKQDHRKVLELFQRAADLGDDDAVTNTGICFARGYGTEQNTRKAIELFHRACDFGSFHATTRLGLCYLKGDGFHRDVTKGLKMIEKGAEMGDGLALFHLGACYFRGEGRTQDQQKGLVLLQKASDQGVPEALLFLGACYKQGHFFPRDEAKANRLYQQIGQDTTTGFWYLSMTGRTATRNRSDYFDFLLSKLLENEQGFTFCAWHPYRQLIHHSF